MRRLATVMTVVTVAATMSVLGTVGAASASPARAARTKAPAKVKPGSTWTLHLNNGGCYTETFATDHAFSDTNDDSGTYKGATNLKMKWKAGETKGYVFSGQWSKTTGDYSGFYDHTGVSDPAILDPAALAPCDVPTPVNS
jgi:hypothetical protein